MQNKHLWLICGLIIIGLLSGCLPYIHEVHGRLSLQQAQSPMLVVAVHENATFFQLEGQEIYQTSVWLQTYPQAQFSNYEVNFNTGTRNLRIYYLAIGYQLQSLYFRKGLGRPRRQEDVVLKKDNQWRNTFALQIKPFLTNLVLEKRYAVADYQKQALADWIKQAEEYTQ